MSAPASTVNSYARSSGQPRRLLLDPWIIGTVCALLLIGLIMVASASIGISEKETGAAVNLVSKAPAADSFREIEAGIGTDSYQRLTFDVNQAVNDAVAFRIKGLWHDAGVAGRDEVYDERAGIAVAVGVRPWESAGFTFDYYYLDVDALPDWGIPYDLANNRPFDVDRSSFYGLTTRDFWDVQSEVATLKFDWTINEALRLENLTRYGATGNAYVASAPEAPNATLRTVQARASNWASIVSVCRKL